VGIGLLVCRAIRSPAAGADRWSLAFWLGWVSTLFALQIWHLVLPVNGQALALAAGVGALGLIAGVRGLGSTLRSAGRGVVALGALAAIALWIANRSLEGPRHGDAGAYFLPTIRWLVEYPIVPGLANLFVPFGFNQSYFLYVAMVAVGPFVQRGYHVANGILVLALVARGLVGLQRLVLPRRRWEPADLFYALFVPVMLWFAEGIFLTTPSPDVGVFVLGVAASGELVRLLSRPAPADARPIAVAIALLAAGGVTVKLSFAGLAAALVALALAVATFHAPRRAAGTVVVAGAVMSLGMVPWMIRNVVLSGRPFYPSTFGALDVEWRAPSDAVGWITAPMHIGVSPWQALRDLRWFLTRIDSLGWLGEDVLVPGAIAAAAVVIGLAGFLVRLLRRRPPQRRVSALIVLVPLASFVFIAETAPMPHYAGATFWLIALESVLIAFANGSALAAGWRRVVAGAAIVAVAGFVVARDRPLLRETRDFATPPAPRLTEMELPSGLVVQVPEYGQCWNAPPPCAPEPNPGLRLRRPGDLGAGFMIDRTT
ncbi:MAG TPA: hypothetical protein VKU61_03130, partial [Candidatus Binatia bacterium]|nr:hypothetical protein [Candidatus Binatia bacterium]